MERLGGKDDFVGERREGIQNQMFELRVKTQEVIWKGDIVFTFSGIATIPFSKSYLCW